MVGVDSRIVILRRISRGATMRLKHRGLIVLGAGLFGVTILGCQEDNESAFKKSAPAATQVGTGKDAPPKNQREYFQQQQAREGSMQSKLGKK
jgi:hypothetical protein